MTTRAIGEFWENAALAYLRKAGLKPIARNFHCRCGEIDLILRDGDTLVFAEVRYRQDDAQGGGAVSVGAAKQRKLVRAAQFFLQAHAQFSDLPCRFDVLGCAGTPQAPLFEWMRNAFEAG
jgi:putative endonuclease